VTTRSHRPAPPPPAPLPPPPGWSAPRRTLILATTPRSGSNWVADLMESTGVMGRPHEWLGWWRTHATPEGTIAGAQEAATNGMTANGIAGMKLFPFYLEVALRHLRLSDWFPDAVWVHLVRRDVLGQAISLWRARESASWFDVEGRDVAVLPSWGHAKGAPPPPYDAADIARCLDQLVAHEADWRRFFGRTGITPVTLVYEEVMADPGRALRTVADALGVDLPDGGAVGPTTFAIQRDEQTEAIRSRFQADAGHPDTPFQALRSFSGKARAEDGAAAPVAPRRGVRRVVQLLGWRARKEC
jgi:LPS sulfotransferase NodH